MKRFKLAILVSVISLAVIINIAAAYVTYGKKWSSNSITYDKSALSTAWQSAAWSGAYQWNAVSPSPFTWTAGNSGSNDVYLGSIDGKYGTLAVTNLWWGPSNTIAQINIKYDDGETWYTGGGIPPSNELDAVGISAHEFGHALGLDHTQWTNCVFNKATMCSTYPYGDTYNRSLETDDKDGINNIYP